MKPDHRTREAYEARILAEIASHRGDVWQHWLDENRFRPAALQRLEEAGKIRRLPVKHPSVLRFEVVRPGGIVKRLVGRWLS